MIIKGVIDEDFVNYKVPSMVIEFPYCNFKCDKEYGMQVCQNSQLAKESDIGVDIDDLIKRYINNPISKSIVMQGLEPMDSIYQLYLFIETLRLFYCCDDDIVIYTGYTEQELSNMLFKRYNPNFYDYANTESYLDALKKYKNIIIKYGRYIPNQKPHYDEILGIMLASDNQYAERIS